MAVKLQSRKPNPAVNAVMFVLVPVVTLVVLYLGIPGTNFNGVRAGVFFGMSFDYNNGMGNEGAGRIMDPTIKCSAAEAQSFVRAELARTMPAYPADSFVIQMEVYPSGYRYRYRCQTWYGQKLFSGGRFFRKGAAVGDPELDADIAARHGEVVRAVNGAIEAYFKSKGAH